MNHIKLFEQYISIVESTQSTDSTFITIFIKFDGNPDVQYDGVAFGISKDPLEAAAFALSAGWRYVQGIQQKGKVIYTTQQAYDILKNEMYSGGHISGDEYYSNSDEIIHILNDLKSGSMSGDVFGEGSAKCQIQKAPADRESYGGYVFDDSGGINNEWISVK